MLKVENMTMEFGGLRAVDSLNLSIEKGQIFALIGPNGAGKSTAFNCIAGTYTPTTGTVTFDGERINGCRPWNLCKKGLARTFHIVKPFASKSVLYNVTVGAFATTNSRKQAEERAMQVLESLAFADKKDMLSGNLTIRSEERRVGKECRRLCRSRWSPYH
jgi:branched-chain amino acid transport system ATP-binding protein